MRLSAGAAMRHQGGGFSLAIRGKCALSKRGCVGEAIGINEVDAELSADAHNAVAVGAGNRHRALKWREMWQLFRRGGC